MNSGRGERIRTSALYVPNVALYLTKLHPAVCFAQPVAAGQHGSQQFYKAHERRVAPPNAGWSFAISLGGLFH